jgi:hypothetical protein
MPRTKRLLKSAAAAVPLVIGMASPASACLLTGASETAAQRSPQIEKGPFGIGPSAPVSGLQNADAHSPQQLCFTPMMCDPSGQFHDD